MSTQTPQPNTLLREPSPEYVVAGSQAGTYTLPVPADLYARLQDYAAATGKRLEQALADTLEKGLRRAKPRTERERVLQALEMAGLLLPAEPPPPGRPLTTQQRADLELKFSVGRPLSEIIIEERAERC